MKAIAGIGVLVAMAMAGSASAADLSDLPRSHRPSPQSRKTTIERLPVYKGRVAVIDGRTLWYPRIAQKVRLVDIDACELPQWTLDPKWVHRGKIKSPPPVPCGALAKAWLKRTVGTAQLACTVIAYDRDGIPLATCRKHGRDIALEMLRVGWAMVSTPHPTDPRYLAVQRHAMAARYGIWKTYVLDMDEWRRKAVDKTLDRQPIADFNLLSERESEISPPFHDAHNRPRRTDR